MMKRKRQTWMRGMVLIGLAAATGAWAQEPDWASMVYTLHREYQAVDAAGSATFPMTAPVKMRGVILNRPQDMLNTAAGADPFMGGCWQVYVQAVDSDDFGGTALWMGQNIGKINSETTSYTDAEWGAEVGRLSHDPASGREFRPGDLIEVRARAPGLFNRGKTNINEQHVKDAQADFDVVLVQANDGLPEPEVLQLSDLKDVSDQFIFDETRMVGNEHYQATAVRINNVSFTSTTTWGPGGQLTIQDGAGLTFPVLLGRGEGFTRYAAPTGSFDIVGILDQEDKVATDGYKAGYRLWVMDYTQDGEFVLYRYVKPDFDRDGDVDAGDLAHFEACVSGPAITQSDPACLNADFDRDIDVDLDDFGLLQRCHSGTDKPADATCDQ